MTYKLIKDEYLLLYYSKVHYNSVNVLQSFNKKFHICMPIFNYLNEYSTNKPEEVCLIRIYHDYGRTREQECRMGSGLTKQL